MIAKWVPFRLVHGDVVLAEIDHLDEGREYSGKVWGATVFTYRPNGQVSCCYSEYGSFSEAQTFVRRIVGARMFEESKREAAE